MCAFHYCIIFFKLLLYNSTVSVIQVNIILCCMYCSNNFMLFKLCTINKHCSLCLLISSVLHAFLF